MYNLAEYSDNYLGTSGSLWQFKREKTRVTNDGNPDNIATNNSTTFEYKPSNTGKTAADGANGKVTGAKLVLTLKSILN